MEARTVGWDDPLVREISYDCGSESVRRSYQYIRAVAYRNRRHVCCVLGDVGYFFGYFGKRHFRLVEIAVREREQGRGYGSELMRYLVQLCKDNGAERITLRCSIEEGSWPFYIVHGFGIVGRSGDDYEMELELGDYLD